jgi:hypothetical protein
MIIKKGIYKGWNLMSAIKDLTNLRLSSMKNDKYPDWFKNQFTNLKEK